MSETAGKSVKQAKREAKGNGKKRLTGPILVLLFIIIFGGSYLWSRMRSSANAVSIEADRPIRVKTADEGDDGTLRIATFNIAHGRGAEPDASNWVKAERDRIARLKDIGEMLAELDADIVVLNEVDFDAVWSGQIDQADLIAEHGGYPHIARQRNYDVAVPLVKWRFGNAILSRYPISSAREVSFEPLSAWESIVWGNHDSMIADITLPDGTAVVVWAVHLEVQDEAIRIKAAQRIVQEANAISEPLFVLGDFNSGPSTFPHTEPTDAGETAFDILVASEDFNSFPATDVVPTPGDGMFTYPSAQPVRTIDWILIPRDWEFESAAVHQPDFSDHLPVVATVKRAEPIDASVSADSAVGK